MIESLKRNFSCPIPKSNNSYKMTAIHIFVYELIGLFQTKFTQAIFLMQSQLETNMSISL